jgi:hypothetical protein
MKLAERYSKEILDKKMGILKESFVNDKKLLKEYRWYMSQSEETRKLLNESWLGDKLSGLKDDAVALGKKIGAKVSDAWERFKRLVQLAKEYANKAWDYTVDAVVAGFKKAFDVVKNIGQESGGVAAMKEMGVELEPGGDANGMESNPDIVSMFL